MIFEKLFHRQQHQDLADSSAIAALDYTPSRQSLIVTFINGRRYQYGCVQPETYRQLRQASSAGRFFHSEIRGKYPYRQLSNNSGF